MAGLANANHVFERSGARLARHHEVALMRITGRGNERNVVWVVADQMVSLTHHTFIHDARLQGACQRMSKHLSDTLSCMQLNMAQVLNTIAHEIRTPLAVSQGYLKLYLDGRLTNADDQRRAFQQTREALGTLATLCTDMGKVSALSEKPSPALLERVPAPQLIEHLKGAGEVAGAEWSGEANASVSVASNGAADLVRAVAIVARAAFDEAREEPRAMRVAGEHGSALTVLAGTPAAIAALEAGPGATAARDMDFVRGGKGLTLIWAAFVLQQHRVHAWTHQDHRAAVGFRFPVVQA